MAVLAAQTGQYNADLLLRRKLPPGSAADRLDNLFCRFLHRPGFLSHLRSLNGYDGPEILPISTQPICLIGADAGQSTTTPRSPRSSVDRGIHRFSVDQAAIRHLVAASRDRLPARNRPSPRPGRKMADRALSNVVAPNRTPPCHRRVAEAAVSSSASRPGGA